MTRCKHRDKFLLSNLVSVYQDQVAVPAVDQHRQGPGAAVTTPSTALIPSSASNQRPPGAVPAPGLGPETPDPGAEGPWPPSTHLPAAPRPGPVTRNRARRNLL